MFCKKCGASLGSEMIFCAKCGNKVELTPDYSDAPISETEDKIVDEESIVVEENETVDEEHIPERANIAVNEETIAKDEVLEDYKEDIEKKKAEGISEAKQLYLNKDYIKAFPMMLELAENGDAESQNLLAQMYLKGQGTESNIARAEFWWKEAIKKEDSNAKCNYAEFIISKYPGAALSTKKELKHAFQYLVESAVDNNKAVDLLVTLLTSGRIELTNLDNIIELCKKAEERNTGAFEKNKYKQYVEVLNELKISEKKQIRVMKLASAFSIVASVITVISIFLILLGLHGDIVNVTQFGRNCQTVAMKLIIMPRVYSKWIYEYCDYLGVLGFQLLFLAGICNGLSKLSITNIKAKVAYALMICVFLISLAIHMYIEYLECLPMLSNMMQYIVMVIIPMIVGNLIGYIAKKIVYRYRTKKE